MVQGTQLELKIVLHSKFCLSVFAKATPDKLSSAFCFGEWPKHTVNWLKG